jgi:hypothetical protein
MTPLVDGVRRERRAQGRVAPARVAGEPGVRDPSGLDHAVDRAMLET